MTRANEEALEQLTDEFNARTGRGAGHAVGVAELRGQPHAVPRRAVERASCPTSCRSKRPGLQYMIDSASVLPAAVVHRRPTSYDTCDFIERVVNYYTVDDVLWPMPFNVSNPILYYNKAAFERAGLDPSSRRRRSTKCARPRRRSSTRGANPYGIVIKLDPWYLEQWFGQGRRALRQQRATAARAGDRGRVRQRDRTSSLHVDQRHGRRRVDAHDTGRPRSTTTSRSATSRPQ